MSSRLSNTSKILSLAFIYALLVTTARVYILEFNSNILDLYYFSAVLIGLSNEFLIGLIISYILFILRNTVIITFFFVFILFLIMFQIACFHYEAVFGSLPGFDVFFYINELEHLSSSLQANIPVGTLVTESVTICIIFYVALHLFKYGHVKFTFGERVQAIVLTGATLISVILQTSPSLLPESLFWGSREPAIWIIQSKFIKERYDLENLNLDSDDFQKFLYLHGQVRPVSRSDIQFPLCNEEGIKSGKQVNTNVIILVLEGVGQHEMFSEYTGQALMPNLQRIANENLYFEKFYAPGTKSIQALPAIFSGLPAQPHLNYLWKTPLLNFEGFPNHLAGQGYQTTFLHGSDLSFERQRLFIREIGFNEIIEYDHNFEHQVHGWGYDDGVMFASLQRWIDSHQNNFPDIPYLVSLFTLSTHDPYILPVNWNPKFSSETRIMNNPADWSSIKGETNTIAAMVESYAFLDHHLGEFYDWYTYHADNALLIITSDHAPHLVNEVERKNTDNIRFNVPFIVAGLNEFELKKYSNYDDRIGAMYDLPATIMGLLNQRPHRCNLGVNLLASEDEWYNNRYIYSVSGDTLDRVFIRNNEDTVIYDRIRDEYRWLDGKNNLTDTGDFKKFFNTISPVHFYLLEKNSYFPSRDKIQYGQSIKGVNMPLFVSHRGNVYGPASQATENRRPALEAAINSGFKWLEIDIQMTMDGIPVLLHDEFIQIQGKKSALNDITLEQLHDVPEYSDVLTLEEAVNLYSGKINLLVEIKPVSHISMILHAAREISRIIRNRTSDKLIIVDSFQEILAKSVKQYCECEAGYDASFKKKLDIKDLEHIKKMNMDWVYVHFSVIDKKLIQDAHSVGLKVMAYTVNDENIVQSWKSEELPDGIITDYFSIYESFNQDKKN